MKQSLKQLLQKITFSPNEREEAQNLSSRTKSLNVEKTQTYKANSPQPLDGIQEQTQPWSLVDTNV